MIYKTRFFMTSREVVEFLNENEVSKEDIISITYDDASAKFVVFFSEEEE